MYFLCFYFLSFTMSPQPPDYFILFTRIDNQVKVYVEGDLIYDSEIVDGNPDLNIKFNFTDYLKKGKNELRVDLYNGSGYNGSGAFDEHWEVYYEVFEDNVPIEYINESSSNGKSGLVFSATHEINVR